MTNEEDPVNLWPALGLYIVHDVLHEPLLPRDNDYAEEDRAKSPNLFNVSRISFNYVYQHCKKYKYGNNDESVQLC